MWFVLYYLILMTGLFAAEQNFDELLFSFCERGDPGKTFQDFFRSISPLNVNARDSEGNTPLMFAVSGGHSEIVDTLLQNGADPYLENNHGETAFKLIELTLEALDIMVIPSKIIVEGGGSVQFTLQRPVTPPPFPFEFKNDDFVEPLSFSPKENYKKTYSILENFMRKAP